MSTSISVSRNSIIRQRKPCRRRSRCRRMRAAAGERLIEIAAPSVLCAISSTSFPRGTGSGKVLFYIQWGYSYPHLQQVVDLARCGTSPSPTTQSQSNGDSPVFSKKPRIGEPARGCLVSAEGPTRLQEAFQALCLWPQKLVSQETETRFAETRRPIP
jgi:hypothetical protein